ncbi:nucleotide disphospho-sugar-binding domain-containing protein [Amycolatopsis sp. YIM 10]|uniref:nucleotide disphospho-sugar-binding domain-containing protein n=1 Tax=Amycolatopsis sp. YIM 10 TaxID=2653857 RepID=UPI0012903A09|nr:nucleotide disphospho-sugar-binding domain-containing protein [Amycolatopsis sp. YIM 10]QFU92151.1 L-noviosyl transferase [Amycolatopsis sp. YIM 10]
MRILVTTVALPGHFFPLVPLAWAGRVAGHEVLVACAAEFVPTVLGSGLPAVSTGPGERFDDVSADDSPAAGVIEQRTAHGRVFGRMAARNVPGLTAIAKTWKPDLVLSERAEFGGPLVAAKLGLPQVELHWGIAELPEYRTGAATELTRRGLPAPPTPERRLNPWPPSLRKPYAARHDGIRTLSYNGEARVPDWVMRPRRRPRICLTLGTVVPRNGSSQVAHSAVDIVRALCGLGADVVVAIDDRIAASWPPLPPAVRHVGRLSLSQVFPACDVAVHHGGQGTSLTALEAGLPQLVLPVFDDQFDNADAVVRAGAGVRMLPREVEPSAIAERCAEVLESGRYRPAAEVVAREIAAQPTPVEVLDSLSFGGLRNVA